MNEEGLTPLPGGYHEKISVLINEIIPLCEKAFAIADEFGEDDESSLVLSNGEIEITIKKNE